MIVLPYGDQHTIGATRRRRAFRSSTLLDPPPWDRMPLVRHGGGGAADRPRVRLPVLRRSAVRPRRCGRSRRSSSCACPTVPPRAGCRRASPTRSRRRSPSNASTSLDLDPASRAGADRGAAAAPRDRAGGRPGLARGAARPGPRTRAGAACTPSPTPMDGRRARAARRRCRARCSTSASARCSDARRSVTSPSGACTSPRSCSPRPTSASSTIARRVGYDSEEAFSRAFKRARGLSPSHWRAARADGAS